MAFHYKALIGLVPAALLVLSFQNCAPQKFAQTTAASEKSFSISDPVSLPPDMPDDSSDGTVGGNPSDDKKSDDKKSDDKKSDSQSDSKKYAANCKAKRAQYESFGAVPQDLPLIRAQGSSDIGPLYVSHVGEISAVGSSETYVVAAKSDKMVKADALSAVGSSKVILCGVYPINPSVKGSAELHIIGAVVGGTPELVGSAKIKVYDADGNPI